jgi:hypothetical protein
VPQACTPSQRWLGNDLLCYAEAMATVCNNILSHAATGGPLNTGVRY